MEIKIPLLVTVSVDEQVVKEQLKVDVSPRGHRGRPKKESESFEEVPKKHYNKRKKAKIVFLNEPPKIRGKRKQKWWTRKERAFLDKARHTLKIKRIAKLLRRSEQSIRCQIWLLQHPERR